MKELFLTIIMKPPEVLVNKFFWHDLILCLLVEYKEATFDKSLFLLSSLKYKQSVTI